MKNSAATQQFFKWFREFESVHKVEYVSSKLEGTLTNSCGISIYLVRAWHNSIEFVGVGADMDPSLAFLKSLVELCERILGRLFFPEMNSNGNACHFVRARARASARSELFERDAFFTHFLANRPFRAHRSISAESKRRQRLSNLCGAEVDFFTLDGASSKLETVLCVARAMPPRRAPFAIGISSSETLADAERKSSDEALRGYDTLTSGKLLAFTDESLVAALQAHFRPDDHGKLGMDPAHVKPFSKQFLERSALSKAAPFDPRVQFLEPDLSETEFANSGLVFVRAVCAELQAPFWGLLKAENVNLPRLARVAPNMDIGALPWRRLHLFA